MSGVESQPLANAVSNVGRETLRIVLPSWCISCRRALPWRERNASCCVPCWSTVRPIEQPQCPSCALPIGAAGMCLDCVADPLPVEWCGSWGAYGGVLEKLLQALKYERHDFLDGTLAALLEQSLRKRGDLAFHALVPVPMHPAKERRRGYNQADLLARALAPRIGIPVKPLLAKTLDRRRQASLTRRERATNVRNTFIASNVENLSVLLIDDVCTTGETLRACATELLARGAARVCALTVAKA